MLDDKVRRVLTLLERTGRLDDEPVREEECIDDPVDRELARRAATESFVLLTNDGEALPLASDVKVLAVIGPNADATNIQGGGSARVTPHPPVSPLAGLRARFASDGVEVAYERGCDSFKHTPVLDERVLAGPLRAEYFAGRERAGEPVHVESSGRAAVHLHRPGRPRRPDGVLDAHHRDGGGAGVGRVDVLARAGRAGRACCSTARCSSTTGIPKAAATRSWVSAAPRLRTPIELTAGEPHAIEVEFVPPGGLGGLQIGCRPPAPADLMDRAVALARRADAVVCVVGTDGDWETEGNDRDSMALPAPQDELVRAVAAANPNVVVVVNAASPVEMPWVDDVGAILQCWFPGEEWGNALADVLSGDVSPSGKLATTIPAAIEDTPAFKNYPGEVGAVRYGEGVFVGYRWYDARAARAAVLLRSRLVVHVLRAERAGVGRSHSAAASREHGIAARSRGRAVLRARRRRVGGASGAGVEGVREGVARSRRGA